ncbi:uncharacterized protein LOC130497839 [Raphanus sativus]|uniref:Uncharacterized protein LOC130497839 n=1 Tax=Raphanus sativus TaxID=3726 RepID=A0A9W3C647_RAPSA|nr:uncharacterized protein LOC130497839 [Raphanus sativus]
MNPDKSPGPDGMSAAFYRQHWETIKPVMRKMGLCQIWRNGIMKCITTVSYTILINRDQSRTITPHRGLRQDDSLLFCKATGEETCNLRHILNTYQQASGQEINYTKSSISFSKG